MYFKWKNYKLCKLKCGRAIAWILIHFRIEFGTELMFLSGSIRFNFYFGKDRFTQQPHRRAFNNEAVTVICFHTRVHQMYSRRPRKMFFLLTNQLSPELSFLRAFSNLISNSDIRKRNSQFQLTNSKMAQHAILVESSSDSVGQREFHFSRTATMHFINFRNIPAYCTIVYWFIKIEM